MELISDSIERACLDPPELRDYEREDEMFWEMADLLHDERQCDQLHRG